MDYENSFELLEATLLFSEGFVSVHSRKMVQILEYGLSKETVTVMMKLYKNTKQYQEVAGHDEIVKYERQRNYVMS